MCVYACVCVRCYVLKTVLSKCGTGATAAVHQEDEEVPGSHDNVLMRHGKRQTEVSTYTVGNRAIAPSTQGPVIWPLGPWSNKVTNNITQHICNRRQVTLNTQNC